LPPAVTLVGIVKMMLYHAQPCGEGRGLLEICGGTAFAPRSRGFAA
jgi:hypothetical protein